MLPRLTLLFILLLLVSACASGPAFNSSGVDRSLTPQSVASRPQVAMGVSVLWGGIILNISNLKDSTQIEMLAYPLDAAGRPLTDRSPLGRFILEQAGYLEPATYAEGRQLTVVGTVSGPRDGQAGESGHTQPLIAARQLYLWPPGQGRDGVSIGGYIGFGIGSDDSGGGGIGIGF